MCGIAGVFEYAYRAGADPATIASMLDAIVHRGPDDQGVHVDRGVAIGARRLSIIDLPGGHQPIANEDGTAVVAFNGEIYNYRELRASLRAKGHVLTTEGDTEVIVHLYEEYGEDCVHHLRGMFAFAIWDARRRRLFVARDRLGIKPLYWYDDGDRIVFGSEVKAMLRHPALRPSLDPDALAAFLLLKYVPAPRTMFAGVRALPPGHTLTCDASGVRERQWWDLSFRPAEPAMSEHEAQLRLRELLEDAVRSHLVSDVPFGAFLSGGVDSSTIVALMSGALAAPVRTFSVGFEGYGEEMSELPYARMVAERYGTDHHEVLLGPADFIRLAEKVVWHLDQPIADNACLPNYMVSELARGHVKMVLTGEGGDELFAGYARHAGERLAPMTTRLPGPLRALGRALSLRGPGRSRPDIALYALSQRDEATRLATWFPLMSPEARAELASGRLAPAVDRMTPASLFAEALGRTDATGSLHRMLYVDTKLWLADDLLARGDKTSMATSLEARVPLLDHHLVEFAAGLPPHLKLKGLRRKYLLKQAVRDLLPEQILTRPKKGFPVPIAHWLRGEAREFSRDLLDPVTVARRGLLDPGAVTRLLDDHESGAADHSATLWGLISLELWHQLYLDNDVPAAAAA
jgi:asparagine synthase (glutamine-hydrolysing)